MSEGEERLLTWLEARQADYLHDLADLVAIDSGTRDRAGVNRVVDWLAGRMANLGATVERLPGHRHGDRLIGRWTGGAPGRVLLCGHADTVFPPGTAAARPFGPDPRDGNRLLGPGVCDMKAGLLAALYAMAALRAHEGETWGQVAMAVVGDEEVGSTESEPWLRELAPTFDAALVLEPARANGNLVTARKGGAFWRVAVMGRAAHAGVEPERGASALVQLAHHVLDMEALKDAVPGATLVMGTARAGEAANMVPPRARMTVDGRAPSAEAMAALVAAVEAGLENPSRRVPGTTTTVEGGPTRPPMPRTAATARLFELARESALRLGFDVGEEATGGGSDGNLLAAAGLPVLDGLGPVGGATHSRHEYVLADSLAPRTAMLASLIARVGAGGLAAE